MHWLHPESKPEIDPDNIVGDDVFNLILAGVEGHPAYPHARTNRYLPVWVSCSGLSR